MCTSVSRVICFVLLIRCWHKICYSFLLIQEMIDATYLCRTYLFTENWTNSKIFGSRSTLFCLNFCLYIPQDDVIPIRMVFLIREGRYLCTMFMSHLFFLSNWVSVHLLSKTLFGVFVSDFLTKLWILCENIVLIIESVDYDGNFLYCNDAIKKHLTII